MMSPLKTLLTAGTLLAACGGDEAAENTPSDSNSGSGSEYSTAGSTDTSNGGASSDAGSMSGGASEGGAGSESDSASTSGGGSSTGSTGGGSGSDTGPTGGPNPGDDAGDLCPTVGELRGCYTFAPSTWGNGLCRGGTQTCERKDADLGEWTACTGDTGPDAEVCDDEDNDCNGQVDDGLGETNCGLAQCNHTAQNCVGGMDTACDPFHGVGAETCDGEDEDCDGDIDEDLGGAGENCGLGECDHTVNNCAGGSRPVCDPFEGQADEVCDLLDNDCDGLTDEGFGTTTCGIGECEKTVERCVNGNAQACDPYVCAPGGSCGPDTCDNLDNNCDGRTDENQGDWTCGTGLCQSTSPKCIGGVPQTQPDPSTCQASAVEVCGDGKDNDCDMEAPPCSESTTGSGSRPIDVVIAIDSSSSMGDKIARVETELNAFATALDGGGGDNSFLVLADWSSDDTPTLYTMCVETPLNGNDCDKSNPANRFWQFDTNGQVREAEFVHSENALGRLMQNWKADVDAKGWGDYIRPEAMIAFLVVTDDNGDDRGWGSDDWSCATTNNGSGCWDDGGDAAQTFGLNSGCAVGSINDATTGHECRYSTGGKDFTSLAENYTNSQSAGGSIARYGFKQWMEDKYPNRAPIDDWKFYGALGGTGNFWGTGSDSPSNEYRSRTDLDQYEIYNTRDNEMPNSWSRTCDEVDEYGHEYLKLMTYTDTVSNIVNICDSNWDLAQLGADIASSVPQNTFTISGQDGQSCRQVDVATLVVAIDGIPLLPTDWSYDSATCLLTITNTARIPTVGQTVTMTYEYL